MGSDLTAVSHSSYCMLKSSQRILHYGQGSSVSFLELGPHGITKPDKDPRLPRTPSLQAVDLILSQTFKSGLRQPEVHPRESPRVLPLYLQAGLSITVPD